MNTLGWQLFASIQLPLFIFVYKPNIQNTTAIIIRRRIEYLKYEKNKGTPTPKNYNYED